MLYQDAVIQIRELLERNLDPFEIANRLHIDISFVEQVIQLIGP